MDITKLKKAAALTANKDLSQEILRIAQNLEGVDMGAAMQAPAANPMVGTDQGMNDPGIPGNPNIKSFAKPGGGVERELHKITIQVEVPPGTDETSILNKIMEKLKIDMEESGEGFRLKGYSFDER